MPRPSREVARGGIPRPPKPYLRSKVKILPGRKDLWFLLMPVSSLSSKGQVTIPKAIREHLGLEAGNGVEFVVDADGRVIVRKQLASARPLRGMLHDFAPATPPSLDALEAAAAEGVSAPFKPSDASP